MASEKLRKLRLRRARRINEPPNATETSSPPDEQEALALRSIAAEADDLKAIKKALEDAASVGAPLWLSYLFLLFYIAIAVAGVTHADLLLESPVELPFLNIKLPLIAFFVLSPILFVVVHAYVMAHFALLSDKTKRFHTRLRETIRDEHQNAHNTREGLRRQLPINIFVQFLAGPTDIREGLFSILLWAVAWISLVAGPVLVLLLLQAQFLPFHDSRVTWVHRGALIFDLVVIWWLWMKIISGRSMRDAGEQMAAGRWTRFWDGFLRWSRNIVVWPLTIGIFLLSVLVSTFPGEWREWPYTIAAPIEPAATWVTQAIFGKVDPLNKNKNEQITRSWPVNTLRLKEFDLYEALKVDDPKKLDLKPHTYLLHDRRLEQADLRSARLGKADLRNAHLEGAWLDKAQLQGASLLGAELQGATLQFAQLQDVSLRGVQFQGARLDYASLQGASLRGAELQGASLLGAQLQGASLLGAQLQGASLNEAQLQGASLRGAQLQGASLRGAIMMATDLTGAFLWRSAELPLPSASATRDLRWGAETTSDDEGNESWTHAQYARLRNRIKEVIPDSERQTEALERIKALDCARASLAPCSSKAKPPEPLASELQEANAGLQVYEKALAETLRDLVCGGNRNAGYILRGVATNERLLAADHEAFSLIGEVIEGKKCPVSDIVTEADKTMLLKIKEALAKSAAKEAAQQQPAPALSGRRPPSPGGKKKPQ
jgi:uncharacterized protein YjbI with pentapeptide repeats